MGRRFLFARNHRADRSRRGRPLVCPPQARTSHLMRGDQGRPLRINLPTGRRPSVAGARPFIYNGKRDTKPPDEGPARKEPAWQRRSEPASGGASRPTRARCWRRRRPATPNSASRCSSTPTSTWCACPFPTTRCAPSTPTSFWTTTAPPPSWTWASTTRTASRPSSDALAALGRSWDKVQVVLTHSHPDHTGNLDRIWREGMPVLANLHSFQEVKNLMEMEGNVYGPLLLAGGHLGAAA